MKRRFTLFRLRRLFSLPFRRLFSLPLPVALALLPLLVFGACSSGSGTEPLTEAALALAGVTPVTISATEDVTLVIDGETDQDGDVFLDVGGAGRFRCEPDDTGALTCRIRAGDVPPGAHDLKLVGNGVQSDVIEDGLIVEIEFRTIDGFGNNPIAPELGGPGAAYLRLVAPAYADGDSALAGPDRPNPRVISNVVNDQEDSIESARGASDFVWQWGQFIDHDIDLTPEADPREDASIPVPDDDPLFGGVIALARSAFVAGTSPRDQLNGITAFIDASNVYGSDSVRAQALRTLDGTGRLRTSDGDLLPFNDAGFDNAGGPSAALFLAGDVRANEQAGLTAMHTLFLREHNRRAGELRARHPDWTGDDVYEHARLFVGALMQVITYREFLPALLGPGALAPYRGYDETVDPGIANVFATSAYRFGHTTLSPQLLRLDAGGDEIAAGHVALRDAFFNPELIQDDGIDALLRGLAGQTMQEVDVQLVDDVRNFLFGSPGSDGAPGSGGLDLASLNIQRGRDHGLATYNDTRAAFGLARKATFADITSDAVVQARLAAAYASVEELDSWVGGLAESHAPGALVGELVFTVLKDQFERLRDGDRFWYQRALPRELVRELERTRLSDVIRRNTDIGSELPDDVFAVSHARPAAAAPPRALTGTRRDRLRARFGR